MAFVELDTTLTSEVKAMRDLAHQFAVEVMRPAGITLDKLADPADVIKKGSVLWEVHRKYREIGFGQLDSLNGGGSEVPPIARTLITEQLGYGDAGLAISLAVSSFPFALAMLSSDASLRQLGRAYADDKNADLVGCWAVTEPDHGSDWIMAVDKKGVPPGVAPNVRAKLVGDEYILSGMKAAWVSNGTIATHAVLHLALDPGKGMNGTGLAVCPLDLPGIARGKPLDKIGQRPLNQGEIIFEEVKLPRKYMVLANPTMMGGMLRAILTGANTGMSTTFSGLALAVFDVALAYAKERIQGGVPIIEHQNIKLKLFSIFKKAEAARALARAAAAYNGGRGLAGSIKHAVAAKVFCTETAFEVASEAIQIHGGNGLAKEYPVEKMFRDARASMIEDGVNESLAIAVAPDL